jgi:hypothetical protein
MIIAELFLGLENAGNCAVTRISHVDSGLCGWGILRTVCDSSDKSEIWESSAISTRKAN